MHVALTGAATGIGASVAAKFKATGATITAFDIHEPTKDVDRWIQVDMGDGNSIASAVEHCEGPFDVLINNAGLPPRDGLEETILRVNYAGLVLFLDAMLDRLAPGAAIVNTASRAGAMWRDNLEEVKALRNCKMDDLGDFIKTRNMDATRAYNLTKESVIVMTMARCEEMIARGIRMNSVSPAAVSTGILDDFVAAFGPRVAKNIERAGRAGLPDEVADVILFLASPQSHWIKGQDIVIDGGMGAMIAADMLELA